MRETIDKLFDEKFQVVHDTRSGEKCIFNIETENNATPDELKNFIHETVVPMIENQKLQDILDNHRDKAVITCEETCWCWDIEQALLKQGEE